MPEEGGLSMIVVFPHFSGMVLRVPYCLNETEANYILLHLLYKHLVRLNVTTRGLLTVCVMNPDCVCASEMGLKAHSGDIQVE